MLRFILHQPMTLLQSSKAIKLQSELKVWSESFLVLETKPDCGLQSTREQCEGTGNMHGLRKPQVEVHKIKQPYPDLQSINFFQVLLPGVVY